MAICKGCGARVKKADTLEYAGELYCSDCAYKCVDCGAVVLESDWFHNPDGEGICGDCYDDNYFTCPDCGGLYSNDDGNWIDSIDGYVCYDCGSNYASCYECGYSQNISDMYWSNDHEAWYCEDCYEGDEDDEDNRSIFKYHSGEGRTNQSKDYRYRVGIELEREDGDFIDGFDKHDFLEKTGWVVEADCSLDCYIGFEAVSPVYPLKIGEMRKLFKSDTLKKLARTKYSDHCGGHITISDTKRIPNKIVDDIAGYLPIIYALFPHRVYNSYCGARNKEVYKGGGHCALNVRCNIMGGGLEFRIFDAPKDEDDILNRFRLLLYMLQHTAPSVEEALQQLSESNKLRRIIKYQLKKNGLNYEQFYTGIIKYAKAIDDKVVRVRAVPKI